jgi:biopolymer transport protein ExbD
LSLEKFKAQGNIIHPIVAIGFINFVLTIMLLVMSTTIFARPSGVQMEFPSFKEGLHEAGAAVVITVSAENVIYIDGRAVTLNELRRFLAQGHFRRDVLMVKANANASMGRVADILDICRGISGASVNVSTIF